MAEDIRYDDTEVGMTDPRTPALAKECEWQYDNCRYSAATFHIWLRWQRGIQRAFIVLPILFSAVATWTLLDQTNPVNKWITGGCALMAGILPAIYEALKLDVHLDDIASAAGEFTILRDRFRQLQTVTALGPFETFKAEFDAAMTRLDEVRRRSLTPPESYFRAGQKKVKAGHYDADNRTSGSSGGAVETKGRG
jgi:hypothetical protein